MATQTDTIAAIATAAGAAGISIVRLSGPAALSIADAVFRGPVRPSDAHSHTFVHGHIAPDAGGSDDLDEVILLVYRQPRSYTREDVVEIQGHGGRLPSQRILRAVLAQGARPAEPGEFTRRAFLNGRIDLLQAEAVADLIMARSERAAATAMEQLEGRLSTAFGVVYDELMTVAADCEAILDFGDDELPDTVLPNRVLSLRRIVGQLEALLASWEEGHLLRDGARVVIAGRPNVGKSTLLNALLGHDRAIVSEAPGTTRDTIEEELILGGVPLRLTDTAGLRDADCHIEKQGIQRAQASMSRADITIYIIDGSTPLTSEDRTSLQNAAPSCLVVLNKQDLGTVLNPSDVSPHVAVTTSLKTGSGLDSLKDTLLALLGILPDTAPHATISERHRQLVQSALNALNEGCSILERSDDADLVPAASLLRQALEQLGEATGAQYTTELLDKIFSRFCIGK